MCNDERVYKEYVSQTFNRAALSYDRVGPRFFSHFGNRLLELAEVWNGASVLDVGSGRGAILFPAAEKAGRAGQVIGIDIAEAMVQQTAKEIARRGLGNVEARQMDAEALLFPDATFDFVFWGFVLYEFFDLDRALVESFRVLKPKGVFALSVWGKQQDARWDGFRNVIRKYRDQMKPLPPGTEGGPPGRWDPAEMEAVLSKAGFVNVRSVPEEKEFYFKDQDEWWTFEWSCANRITWERFEAPALERVKRDAFEFFEQLKQADGIPILFRMLLTRANKP
jgi:ubiquinone/menaquinone biosynthesis C-methylase UbiE